jgi:hypothetical protein
LARRRAAPMTPGVETNEKKIHDAQLSQSRLCGEIFGG